MNDAEVRELAEGLIRFALDLKPRITVSKTPLVTEADCHATFVLEQGACKTGHSQYSNGTYRKALVADSYHSSTSLRQVEKL